MCCMRFTMSSSDRKAVERQLKTAQHLGNLRQVKYLLALLAVLDGQSFAQVAGVLRVHEKTVATWVGVFCCYGVKGAPRRKPTGRPPKLTPTQQAALATLIDKGPVKAGFSGACWRSPMIQQLIYARFGVFYNVFYIAQWLKNLGLSFQKAACVSDHLDEAKRQAWRTTTWPHILRRATERKALLLFGDEASFPQWGTLTYTWARRGQQPKIKTCGKRKGYIWLRVVCHGLGRMVNNLTMPWDRLLEEREAFRAELWGDNAHPGHVPPGEARLATNPDLTGSPAPATTIGMVSEAALAARASCTPKGTMTSTGSWTNSVARSWSRSVCPSA